MKKITKILWLMIIMLSSFFCVLENVEAAPVKVKTSGNPTLLSGYVSGTKFYMIPLNNGTYTYCLNIHKKVPRSHTMKLAGELDAGITYLMENGYPNKSITGNSKKDYYITQTAVWWYLDKTTGASNLSNSFKSTGSDEYKLRSHIKTLVNNAVSAKKRGYQAPTLAMNVENSELKLTADNKYYESKDITISGSLISSAVSLNLPNNKIGAEIVSSTGSKKKSFKVGERFRVRIPSQSLKQKTSINVEANATGSINKAYEYRPTNNDLQNVSILYPVSIERKAKISLSVSPSTVNIIKVDKITQKPLEGASMVLKNKDGKTIESWTSTTEAHQITVLPNGTYSLKEVKAPEGYNLNEKEMTFTVTDENRNITIKMENTSKSIVNIIKVDKITQKPLEGALLILKNAEGKTITSWTSTTNAHRITNLPNGTYIVKESKAPKGYSVNEEVITFAVTDNNRNITLKMENNPTTNVVNILKIDASTGTPLKGAILLVKDSKENVVARFKTTEEAYVLKDLEDGEYTVEEESAPEGYETSTEKKVFTIDEEHISHQITFENYPETIVPFTKTSTSAYVLGSIILLIGIGFVYYTKKKNG